MGVTILAVLAAIGGVLGLLASLPALSLGFSLGGLLGPLILLGLVLSIAQLAFAYGAWTLQPWAWTLGVVLYGINIVLSIVTGLSLNGLGSQIFSIVISGIIIYYLMTPEVKRAFGRA
jgi:hypothetical protein